MNLIKGEQDLYTKNYKTVPRDIKDLIHRLGDLNLLKISILSSLIHRLNVITIEVLAGFSYW